MNMHITIDDMKTLPPLANQPPKIQKLILKVARRLVLMEDPKERGHYLLEFMGLVRDQYITDPTLLPQYRQWDAPALLAEANLRAWFLAALAMREAGDLNERMAKAGAA